jgi:hypothetical protein
MTSLKKEVVHQCNGDFRFFMTVVARRCVMKPHQFDDERPTAAGIEKVVKVRREDDLFVRQACRRIQIVERESSGNAGEP